MATFDEKEVSLRDGAVVTLRSPEEDDAQRLLDYLDAVRRETEGIMFSPLDTLPTLDEELAWVRGYQEDPAAVQVGAWNGDELIGVASVRHGKTPLRLAHRGDIGISLRSPWRGRGLGGEMMRTLIAWAENNPTIELLQLTVFAHNPVAVRLYETLGFTRAGVQCCGARYEDGRYADIVYMSLWVGSGEPVALGPQLHAAGSAL